IRAAEMIGGGLVLLFLLQWFLGYSLTDPDMWAVYQRSFASGTIRTLAYVAIILPVSVILGFAIGWARVSRFRTLAWPATVYVEFFRGVPPLVVVIFASVLGPNLLPERFQSAELGLTLGATAIAFHSAAFQAEIFRAGFQSVSRGQLEAAQAIGMQPMQSMRHVILPQALRLSVPPLSNEFAVLIKDTSLMAIIAGKELFHLTLRVQDTIFREGGDLRWLFAQWTAVAILYFILTFTVSSVMKLVERRFHARGIEAISV
ncbi:MAG TPA: amino acid ABC transporter permease, partial [Thermoplasmata archaeon]